MASATHGSHKREIAILFVSWTLVYEQLSEGKEFFVQILQKYTRMRVLLKITIRGIMGMYPWWWICTKGSSGSRVRYISERKGPADALCGEQDIHGRKRPFSLTVQAEEGGWSGGSAGQKAAEREDIARTKTGLSKLRSSPDFTERESKNTP